jgi:hypothetical protein
MERIGIQTIWRAEKPFHVSLQAGKVGSCEVTPNELSVRIAQHVRRANSSEMWNSVSLSCEEEPGGALVVRVLVFSPDWDGPLQIAELRSWPRDHSNLTPLGCNLNHVAP